MAKTGVYTFLVCVLMGVTAYASFYVAPTESTMHTSACVSMIKFATCSKAPV